MTIRFSAPGSMAAITMAAGFQTLADDAIALSSVAQTNTGRMLFRDFSLVIATQGGNRAGTPAKISLILVPAHTTYTGDAATLITAANYIPKDRTGKDVIWELDLATTARELTWASVCIPPGNYWVGFINESGQAFAGVNAVEASDPYSVENSA